MYPKTCQEPTAKAIFEFSLCALKLILLIVGQKVLTYLVTFKFRDTHCLCNRKGKLNGKFKKRLLRIGECPSIAPFLENNGPRPRKGPRSIVFKEWNDTRTFAYVKSTQQLQTLPRYM